MRHVPYLNDSSVHTNSFVQSVLFVYQKVSVNQLHISSRQKKKTAHQRMSDALVPVQTGAGTQQIDPIPCRLYFFTVYHGRLHRKLPINLYLSYISCKCMQAGNNIPISAHTVSVTVKFSCSSNMMPSCVRQGKLPTSVDYGYSCSTIINIKLAAHHHMAHVYKYNISFFLSVPHYLHAQIVQDALHCDMWLANLHSDRGDLRELEQRGLCDRVSHRLQEVVWRAFDDILSNAGGGGLNKTDCQGI